VVGIRSNAIYRTCTLVCNSLALFHLKQETEKKIINAMIGREHEVKPIFYNTQINCFY